MSLQSWLYERELWDVAKGQPMPKGECTSDGCGVLDSGGRMIATCRDEQIAAVLAALLKRFQADCKQSACCNFLFDRRIHTL